MWRHYKVWLQGRPERSVVWSGGSPQEAAIGALVHLMTSEERQKAPPDLTVVARVAVTMTIADLHRWVDRQPSDSPSEIANQSLLRRHLQGTFDAGRG